MPGQMLLATVTFQCRSLKCVVVDMLDDESDLIDMTVEHDRRTTLRIDFSHAVAGHVRGDDVGEGAGLLTPDSRGRTFVAGWPGCVEKALEKGQ